PLDRLGQLQRLLDDHLQHFVREVAVERAAVDLEAARAGPQEHPGRGRLAASGAVILNLAHVACLSLDSRARNSVYSAAATSKLSGCCAWCGCSPPAYSLSLRICLRPSGPLGSMPHTASSTSLVGRRARRLAAVSDLIPPG